MPPKAAVEPAIPDNTATKVLRQLVQSTPDLRCRSWFEALLMHGERASGGIPPCGTEGGHHA
jgi:hypothetical protein